MFWVLLVVLASPVQAEMLVATRTIRPQTVLMPDDLALAPGDAPGAMQAVDDALGLEARVTLYPGRPIRAADLVAPALVDRNQTVRLIFRYGGLVIATEGRSLGRGAAGDSVRVMNLSSKQTLSGVVSVDGTVTVGSDR